jgi:xylulokinase
MILAVDLGSSWFKAAVFDRNLGRVGAAASALSYRFDAGGIVELDARAVVAAFGDAVTGALRSSGIESDRLRAVAITSQAQTFTITDGQARPKTAFISWQDGRADAGRRALLQIPDFADFGDHCSFAEPIKELQVSQIAFMQSARKGLIAPQDRVVSLPEYLVRLCTGRFAVDSNLAAMSGLYSLRLSAWWPAALCACGIRESQLANVVPVGAIAGRTVPCAQHTVLPPGLPVVLAGNDQTAGAYGAAVHEKRALLLTLGTAQVAYTCEVPHTARLNPRRLGRGPFPCGIEYRMAADTCGGNVVDWAARVLAGCAGETDLFALAALSDPGSKGLIFHPELRRGAGRWQGLGLHHTPSDMARSVLESLTRRMKGMVDDLGVDPVPMTVMVAGGGSRQPVWVDMLSRVLGSQLQVTQADPLLGAARMACSHFSRDEGTGTCLRR